MKNYVSKETIDKLQATEEKQLTASFFGCDKLLSALDEAPAKKDLISWVSLLSWMAFCKIKSSNQNSSHPAQGENLQRNTSSRKGNKLMLLQTEIDRALLSDSVNWLSGLN